MQVGARMLARWREPAEPAHKIALRRLDFDDLCAILAETPGAPWADHHAGEIQDTNSLKRLPGHRVLLPLSSLSCPWGSSASVPFAPRRRSCELPGVMTAPQCRQPGRHCRRTHAAATRHPAVPPKARSDGRRTAAQGVWPRET